MEKKYAPEQEGDFNREDSNTKKRPRTSTVVEEAVTSPFAKDKRPRIRRVTEQLNERTPRPRIPREEGEPSPWRDDRPAPERRFDREDHAPRFDREERAPRFDREDSAPRPIRENSERRFNREEAAPERRRSYNPNFDENNRLRRPTPQGDRNFRPSEEDNRFNSYNYDRQRPQSKPRSPYSDDRTASPRREYTPRDNRGYTPREGKPEGRNYTPREGKPEGRNYTPRNESRDGRPAGKNFTPRDDRPARAVPAERRSPRPGDRKPADPFRTPKGGYDSEYKPKVYPAYAAANIVEPIRLNKFISMSGLCSRREADEFIRQGNVTVNGQVVTEMGVKVSPTDEIRYNGELLQGEKRIYIVMNKPKGFVTTVEDPNADRTVMDIVKNACKERVYPVGRLDKNSLGVLLITNDGELTKRLTHPGQEKRKVYQVTLDRPANPEELEQLYEGVALEDGVAKADEIEFLDEKRREVGITIHTGRNRIVRRMFEELGYHVLKLDRVYFAGLTKKGLRRGAWRYLTPKEVAMIKSGAYQ
ncbi:MAG: RNA-binding S4 domain-containing protein [Rikenellaceae bacterium]|jgi:23S rRNA pseudouridine2605 synthase|nr:RNA-binding S4 domain-containing protein [Rikenellaceae bacterium]